MRVLPLLTTTLPLALALAGAAELKVTNLRCEHLTDPIGLDIREPRISWQFETLERGKSQTAYRILAASSLAKLEKDGADLWDSGKQRSRSHYLVFLKGVKELKSAQDVYWKVKVWDEADAESEWSAPARFTMGLLQSADWKAEWISFKDDTPLHKVQADLHLPAPRYYRKTFEAPGKVKRAVVFSTALGIHELHLNGKRVGDEFFAPGWTDYRRRIYYVTHDVTAHLQDGPNCIGAIVADGWYAGYIGNGKKMGFGPNKTGRNFYGKTPALLVQLHLEFEDGSTRIVTSDPTWKVSTGPESEADLLMGESYDARKELPGWSAAKFDAGDWKDAIPAAANGETKATFQDQAGRKTVDLGFIKPKFVQAYPAPPVRLTQELAAQAISEPKPGTYIFDFGQNFAGNVRLAIKGEAGQKITLRYGEMLHPDGLLMTENQGLARNTDTYICKGDPNGETWSPRFTYHGFRFAEVHGLKEKPGLDALTGLVIHSDTPLTSGFECSDPLVNRIFQNALWAQRSNWVELPTDGPQGESRLGATGDLQVYARASCFHADNAAFFRKWLRELSESRSGSPYFPFNAPHPYFAHRTPYSSGWSDAGISCLFALWWMYGDENLVKEQWVPMKKYMTARRETTVSPKPERFGSPKGDWGHIEDPTSSDFLDLCYFGLDCRLMGEMSRLAGHPIDHLTYNQWFGEVQSKFRERFVNKDGSLKVKSQTAHVLALRFGLLTAVSKKKVTEDLLALLKSKAAPNHSGVTTGLLGTRPLMPVLTWTGNHDLAVQLLQSRKWPSLGFDVEQGATTTWEHRGAFTKKDGFKGFDGKRRAAASSFSDYAGGAVSDWMMGMLAGIDSVFAGFQRIRLEPWIPSSAKGDDSGIEPIKSVRAHYDSCRGRIAVHWERRDDGSLLYECTIPVQTSALLSLPATTKSTILESGKPLSGDQPEKWKFDGGHVLKFEKGKVQLNIVKSGSYRFEVK